MRADFKAAQSLTPSAVQKELDQQRVQNLEKDPENSLTRTVLARSLEASSDLEVRQLPAPTSEVLLKKLNSLQARPELVLEASYQLWNKLVQA